MSNVTRIVAILLLAVAVILGVVAYRIAARPPAPAAAPVVAQHLQPPVPTYPVVVAAKAIAAGSIIDAASLRVDRWPVAPAGAFTQADKLGGEVARVAIGAGEPVTAFTLARGLARYLQPGERAVTIAVDEIVGAANRIMPGDNVDVFITLQRGPEVGGTQARLLQSRVRVLAYGAQSLDGPLPGDKPGAAHAGAQGPARNAMLAVPVEDVNELLLAAREGRLQLALRSPRDTQVADANLFPVRTPVLGARRDLTPQQRGDAGNAVNLAFAGDSLPQLSGPPPLTDARAVAPARAAQYRGHSVEIVRGSQTETVSY